MSKLDETPSSSEPNDGRGHHHAVAGSSLRGKKSSPKPISEAALRACVVVLKKLIEQLHSAISLLTTSWAPSASVIKEQAEVIVAKRLKSNSVIEVLEAGREIAVNGSPVPVTNKQWIVFRILADRLLGGDFSFMPIADIVDEIEKSFQDSTWKYPTSDDVAKTIFALKRKLSKVTSAVILESPEKQGTGYGYRLSVPPQNIIVHNSGTYCNCATRP